MTNTILIGVDELWLKGRNQQRYVKSFQNHIKYLLRHLHGKGFTYVVQNHNHIINSESEFSEEIIGLIKKIPGISTLYLARRVEKTFEAIEASVLEELNSYPEMPKTFKVECKRTSKDFPMNSMEMNRELGGLILRNFKDIKVNVHKPELLVRVKILKTHAFVYTNLKTIKGIGGLPVGMTGKMVTMLSGGFDSPVASFMMSKRGVSQVFAFFHAYPYVGDEVKEKIVKLFGLLSRFQKNTYLYIVPFGEVQKKIATECRLEYRTLLFRKYMIDISALLGNLVGAQALITGDSLGQVSSQTLDNICGLEELTQMPIMRPLIGLNKSEIISIARNIGTYDTSVIPHDDACSLFAPKHPITKPHMPYMREFVQKNDFSPILKEALEKSTVYGLDDKGEVVDVTDRMETKL